MTKARVEVLTLSASCRVTSQTGGAKTGAPALPLPKSIAEAAVEKEGQYGGFVGGFLWSRGLWMLAILRPRPADPVGRVRHLEGHGVGLEAAKEPGEWHDVLLVNAAVEPHSARSQ